MVYHQLIDFLNKDYFRYFPSLKAQFNALGETETRAILHRWAESWKRVNGACLHKAGVEIQQQAEPPEFIEEHYAALNHTLAKYQPLKEPQILRMTLPTEEEAQATRDCVKIAIRELRRIGNQKDVELASRDTARNSPSESITPVEPEMVREYRETVEGGPDG